MKDKKRGAITGTFIFLIFGISTAAITWLVDYDKNQKKTLEQDIKILGQIIFITKKQNAALSKLACYTEKYGSQNQKTAFKELSRALEEGKDKLIGAKKTLRNYEKINFLERTTKMILAHIDYDYYFGFLCFQRYELSRGAVIIAEALSRKIADDKKLTEDPDIEKIVTNLDDAADLLKEAIDSLKELEEMLYGGNAENNAVPV